MPIRLPQKPRRSLEEMLRLVPDASPPTRAPEADPATPVAVLDAPPDPEPTPPFLSLKDAAEWLGVSMSTLTRMLRRGTLQAIRIGARRRLPANYLSAYLARDIITPNQIIDIVQSFSVQSDHIQNTE